MILTFSFDLIRFWIFSLVHLYDAPAYVIQVCVLVPISKADKTILASQALVSSRHSDKAIAETEVTVTIVTGPTATITTDRSSMSLLPSFLQEFIQDHDELIFSTLCTPSCYLSFQDRKLV